MHESKLVYTRKPCCLAMTEINILYACEHNYELTGDHVSLYAVTSRSMALVDAIVVMEVL